MVRFYDIYGGINSGTPCFIDQHTVMDVLQRFGVNVPIVAWNVEFDRAIAWKNDFVSLLTPDDCPNKDNNICEGIVIKPDHSDYMLSDGRRFVIKSKNDKFREKVSSGGGIKIDGESAMEEFGIKDEAVRLAQLAIEMVSDNRLDNVISHSGLPVEYKNFSYYMKELSNDYKKDFESEYEDEIGSLCVERVPSDVKKIMKFIYSGAQKVVVQLLKSRIEGR